MTVVTEGSPGYCAWTNVGPMSPPSWSSFAGISRNSTRVVDAFSNNQYGWDDNVSTYNGDQGTGIFEIAYDSVANSFELLNTATGWQSKTTCSGGTGYNCSGGTLTLAPQGQNSIFNNNCGIFIHNSKGSGTEDYPAIARQAWPTARRQLSHSSARRHLRLGAIRGKFQPPHCPCNSTTPPSDSLDDA